MTRSKSIMETNIKDFFDLSPQQIGEILDITYSGKAFIQAQHDKNPMLIFSCDSRYVRLAHLYFECGQDMTLTKLKYEH